jgi:hypothetical protein
VMVCVFVLEATSRSVHRLPLHPYLYFLLLLVEHPYLFLLCAHSRMVHLVSFPAHSMLRPTVLRPHAHAAPPSFDRSEPDSTQREVGEYSPTEATKPKGASFLGFAMAVVVASISNSPSTIMLRRSTGGAGPRPRSLPAASGL